MTSGAPHKGLMSEVAESLNQGLSFFDADLRLVFCNNRYLELLNFPDHMGAPGTHVADFYRYNAERGEYGEGDTEDLVAERVELALKFEPHRFERERPDGLVLLIEGQPVESGGFVTTYTDVTALRRAERDLQEANKRLDERTKKLEENEALLNSIFESVPVGLLIKDADHKIEKVNGTYLRWYGVSEDEILNRPGTNFQTPEELETMYAQEKEVLTTGVAQSRQEERTFADDQQHNVRITKFPIYDRQGKVTKVGSASIDLTEHVKTEKALQESEKRFRDFTDSSSDWIWETDENHKFTYFSNRRRMEVMGHPESRVIGKTRRDFGPEDKTLPKWVRHFDDLDNHRPFRDFTYEATAADGSQRFSSINGKPIFGEHGKFLGYRGTTTDITDRVLAQRALQESEELFRSVLDLLPVNVTIKNTDFTYRMVNQSLAAMRGSVPDDFVGKSPFDFYPEDKAAELKKMTERVLAEREVVEETIVFDGLDGVVRTYRMTYFPVFNADGEAIATGSIAIDDTERIKTETVLREAKEIAEYANRAKTEFLANMSHELRTPLNAIIGFSDIISNETFGPIGHKTYKSYAVDINAAGRHLHDLMKDILDVSMIEAGSVNIESEVVLIGSLLRDSMKLIEARAKDGRVRLTTDVGAGVDAVRGDPVRLKQILINLLTNAVKFTPAGGAVSIGVDRCASGALRISVRDTGIGICENDIERVLEPFVQVQSAATRGHEGTGLGLTLVNSLARLHGGRVEIASVPDEGTNVTVILPAERVVSVESVELLKRPA